MYAWGYANPGAAAGVPPRGAPQAWQNLFAGGLGAWQEGQRVSIRAPHSPQNLTPAGFS